MSKGWRTIILSPSAERDLRALDLEVRRRILTAIEGLKELPIHGDVKKLKDRKGQWRLRVGDWRVIFEIDAPNRVIQIVRILPRPEAYR